MSLIEFTSIPKWASKSGCRPLPSWTINEFSRNFQYEPQQFFGCILFATPKLTYHFLMVVFYEITVISIITLMDFTLIIAWNQKNVFEENFSRLYFCSGSAIGYICCECFVVFLSVV